MKVLLSAALASAGLALSAATPVVSNVTMAQDAGSHKVTIGYTLANAPAIITVDIQTNGVSIGAKNLTHFSGDVHRQIATDGQHTITWKPTYSWRDALVDKPTVRAVVTAWSPSNPPDVMVVQLIGSAEKEYYTDLAQLPGGLLNNSVYRTTSIVMKRIHCADVPFLMGTSKVNPGPWGFNTWLQVKQITMPHDFYIGVFELTGSQMSSACFDRPDTAVEEQKLTWNDNWQQKPFHQMDLTWMRGKMPSADSLNEPAAEYNTGLGALRAKTGIAFDLPTWSQWQFAARGGLTTDYMGSLEHPNPWVETGSTERDPILDRIATYKDPNMTDAEAFAAGPSVVGSHEPNAYGIYDMFGNVAEYCLDVYTENLADVPTDGSPVVNSSYNFGRTDGVVGYPACGGKCDNISTYLSAYFPNWNWPFVCGTYAYRVVWTLK